MFIRHTLVLTFVMTAVAAHAETTETLRRAIIDEAAHSYNEAVKGCAAPMLTQCLQREVRNATETLAITYKSVENTLRSDPTQTAGLRASQQAWLQFVKTNCGYLGSLTKDLNETQSCMLHYIQIRRSELHTYIGW